MLRLLIARVWQVLTTWQGLLGLAVTLILVSLLIRWLTPARQPLVETSFMYTNSDLTQTQFLDVRYEGQFPVFPAQLPYFLTRDTFSAPQFVAKLSAQYQLSPDPSNPNLWRNALGQRLLYSDLTQQYQLFLTQDAASGNAKALDELTMQAQTAITTAVGSTYLQPIQNEVRFYSSGFEALEPTTFDQAGVVVVPFSYMIESYPVHFQKAAALPFAVAISKSGTIMSITFSPLQLTMSELGQKQIVSQSEALRNVRGGKAAVIAAFQETSGKLDITTLKSIVFNEAKLQYRFDPNNSYTYPFYVLSGTATTAQGKQTSIEVLTPAIATTAP